MRPRASSRPVALAAALTLTLVTACAGYGPHRHYGPPPAGVVYISSAPPPPRTVVVPVRPSSVSVWISGYWDWNGFDFVWIDGRWDPNPPRPRAVWVPDTWVHTDKGWYRHPGRWK